LPWRDTYLECLLDSEARPNNGLCDSCKRENGTFRCLDCFGDTIHCQNCCLTIHRHQSFHRILEWSGKYFFKSSLQKLGHILHLGHRGYPCPNRQYDPNAEAGANASEDSGDSDSEDAAKDIVVVILHTNGVFHHTVRPCECTNMKLDIHLQMLQMGLFCATISRPSTAFTFDILDYFHIDAMECKTAASSFMKKLQRLSNNAFPDKIPVSLCFLFLFQ
jgi:hypothetical protein